MAINPNTRYPGQTVAPSAAYPYGAARNVAVSGDGTGTPLEEDWLNDFFGMVQALLTKAGIVPSNTPDTAQASQILESLEALYGLPTAPLRAFNNLTFTADQPWQDGTSETVQELKYLPNAGRWWCITRDSAGSTFRGYDSADGITWSAGTVIDTGVSFGGLTEDGAGNVYVGEDVEIFRSTTGLVADLAPLGPTFDQITEIRDLVFDPVNNLFIACGSTGTGGGSVETATDPALTWTARETIVGPGTAYTDLATDPVNGVSLVIGAGQTAYYYTSDGITWIQENGPTFDLDDLVYSANMQRFLMIGLDGDGVVCTTDGTDFAEVVWPSSDGPDRWVPVREGVLVFWEENSLNRSRCELWTGPPIGGGASAPTRYKAIALGEFSTNLTQEIRGLGRIDIQYAPQGIWLWPYDGAPDVKIAVSEF